MSIDEFIPTTERNKVTMKTANALWSIQVKFSVCCLQLCLINCLKPATRDDRSHYFPIFSLRPGTDIRMRWLLQPTFSESHHVFWRITLVTESTHNGHQSERTHQPVQACACSSSWSFLRIVRPEPSIKIFRSWAGRSEGWRRLGLATSLKDLEEPLKG